MYAGSISSQQCLLKLYIDFSSNGTWEMHIKKLLDDGRRKVNQRIKLLITEILI